MADQVEEVEEVSIESVAPNSKEGSLYCFRDASMGIFALREA